MVTYLPWFQLQEKLRPSFIPKWWILKLTWKFYRKIPTRHSTLSIHLKLWISKYGSPEPPCVKKRYFVDQEIKIFIFFYLDPWTVTKKSKIDVFLRALGRSSWKHISISLELRKKSEQLAWLRAWLKTRLRLKYFLVTRPELPGISLYFLFFSYESWAAMKKKKEFSEPGNSFFFFDLWTDMMKKKLAWYLNPACSVFGTVYSALLLGPV